MRIAGKFKYLISALMILWLTGGVVYGQRIGFDFPEGKDHATFPFELHNNLIVIPVALNGNIPLRFILDTGVRPTILVSKKFTDSLGIEYQRKIVLKGLGNDKEIGALVTNQISLCVPGTRCNGLPVLVLEENVLDLNRHLGTVVHGIIGYDLFSRFTVKIDYIHKKIDLYNPGKFKRKRKFSEMDINIMNAKPYVKANIEMTDSDTLNARLLIDTGSSHALVLNTGSSDKITIPEKHIKSSLGRSLGGEINGYIGRIKKLELADKPLRDVIVSFPENNYRRDEHGFVRHGAIGGALLKKYTVVFDYLNRKLYLKRNGTFRHPFEYNMSGLEFLALGRNWNKFMINEVRERSPGHKAGFRPGDVVVSLNNIPSKKLSLTRIYTLVNSREGRKVTLSVLRDGKYYTASFRLQREI